MRKAERLFQIVTILRGRRLAVTAKKLAEIVEVSERTIYRDIQALMMSGIPVEGEAGIGYNLPASFELPPLMFTTDELLALMLGTQMVKAWGDKSLAKNAAQAMAKINAILPTKLKENPDKMPFIVPDFHVIPEISSVAEVIRELIKLKIVLEIEYQDNNKKQTSRKVEPLGLVYWGGKWTMIAFCLLRKGYREFRLDRINAFTKTTHQFELLPNKNLQHYLSQYETSAS